jgi:hypothetical protein
VSPTLSTSRKKRLLLVPCEREFGSRSDARYHAKRETPARHLSEALDLAGLFYAHPNNGGAAGVAISVLLGVEVT